MLKLCLVWCLVLLAGCAAVEEISGGEINAESQYQDFTVIKVYMDGCAACNKLAPHYEKAAEILQEEGSEIKLLQMNGPKNAEAMQGYGMSAMMDTYPALFVFYKGAAHRLTHNTVLHDAIPYGPKLAKRIKKKTAKVQTEAGKAGGVWDMVVGPLSFVALFGAFYALYVVAKDFEPEKRVKKKSANKKK
jgi:hypothetical protein